MLKAGEGDDVNSVGTGIGIFTAGDDHQQVGFSERNLLLFLIVFADQFDEYLQVGCSFLDFAAAQFALNQGVSAIVEMQDDVGFQAIAVPIV